MVKSRDTQSQLLCTRDAGSIPSTAKIDGFFSYLVVPTGQAKVHKTSMISKSG